MDHALNFIVLILIIIWLLIPNQKEKFLNKIAGAVTGAAKATSCAVGAGWGCGSASSKPPTCPAG